MRIEDLIQPTDLDQLLGGRFLTREVLEGIVHEGRRASERAALARGWPMVRCGAGTGPPVRVEIDARASSARHVEGRLEVRRALHGLSGGGAPFRLEPLEDGPRTERFSLPVPPGSASVFLTSSAGPASELAVVDLFAPEVFISGVPLAAFRYDASSGAWVGEDGTCEDAGEAEAALEPQIAELERLAMSLEREGSSLALGMRELASSLRGTEREPRARARALARSWRALAAERRGWAGLDDEPEAASTPLELWTAFPSRLRAGLAALARAAEELRRRVGGQGTREDRGVIEVAERGTWLAFPGASGDVRAAHVWERFEPRASGTLELTGWSLSPEGEAGQQLVVAFADAGGVRGETRLEIDVDDGRDRFRWAVDVDPTGAQSWCVHLWATTARACPQGRVRLRAFHPLSDAPQALAAALVCGDEAGLSRGPSQAPASSRRRRFSSASQAF